MTKINEPIWKTVMAKLFSVIGCVSVLILPIDTYADIAVDAQYNIQYFDHGSNEMESYYPPFNIIINNSYNTLYFDYRIRGWQWEENIIRAGGRKDFPCNDSTTAEIRVNTGYKRVKYMLQCRERYALSWNPYKELWDVRRLRD